MTTILRAKPILTARLQDLSDRVTKLKAKGIVPRMRVVLVGDNPASLVYVGHKKKLCKSVGCEFDLVKLPEAVGREEFLNEIQTMNQDDTITGCFVQLPVPPQLSDIDVTALIAPEKDMDGFGAASIVDLYKGRDPLFTPCTPKGILEMLKFYDIPISGKSVAVIGRSLIVGKPISLLLQSRGATVSMCHSLTKDLSFYTKNADIVISAVGRPRFLRKENFRTDQSQVVIDVGICKDQNQALCGDVDFEAVKERVKAITPVPGGVGPLTVLSLIDNLVLASEHKASSPKKRQ